MRVPLDRCKDSRRTWSSPWPARSTMMVKLGCQETDTGYCTFSLRSNGSASSISPSRGSRISSGLLQHHHRARHQAPTLPSHGAWSMQSSTAMPLQSP